jgi:2,4-dienoyl-CoA reductase-like NADH-dependent reductase (Old Yellow Enzyme family)
MGYDVPKNKDAFLKLCEEGGANFPYSEDVSILAESVKVGNKVAPNRIAYQAMEGCDGTADGAPDTLTKRRYDRFAKGGAGIVWFEATAVLREGRANPRQMYIHDGTQDDFKRICADIKETCLKENGYEPLVFMQLTHSGRYSKPDGVHAPMIAYNNPIFEANNPVDPSRIVSDEYLDRLQEALVDGAKRAEAAGFDGADIKSCHRYLLSELLSAYTREGRYGGSYENRTRMIRETIGAAVQATGSDFIVGTRINVYDGFEYPYGFSVKEGEGITPDYTEAKQLMRDLVREGAGIINMTMGNPYFNPHVNRPFARGTYEPPEHPIKGVERMLNGIAEIRQEIKEVPVISSGLSYLGMVSPNVVAGYIRDGGFDFAGYGRETFSNSDTAKNICKNGALDASKLCITCGKCTEIMRAGGTPGCIIRDGGTYMPIYNQYVLKK